MLHTHVSSTKGYTFNYCLFCVVILSQVLVELLSQTCLMRSDPYPFHLPKPISKAFGSLLQTAFKYEEERVDARKRLGLSWRLLCLFSFAYLPITKKRADHSNPVFNLQSYNRMLIYYLLCSCWILILLVLLCGLRTHHHHFEKEPRVEATEIPSSSFAWINISPLDCVLALKK